MRKGLAQVTIRDLLSDFSVSIEILISHSTVVKKLNDEKKNK